VILPWLLGWPGSGLAFDVALQLGTLIAVFVYFWSDLWNIAIGSLRAPFTRNTEDLASLRMALMLTLGTVPAAVIGYVLEGPIDSVFHSGQISIFGLTAIASGLALLGLALLWAERWSTRTKKAMQLGLGQVLLIGLAQSLALMPGVSRSGSTITAGLLFGLERREAARFSFLLSVPVIFGAGVLEGSKLTNEGLPRNQWTAFGVGIAVAGVVGYISIYFLLNFLQTHSTRIFAYYRVALALAIGVLVASGWNIP